MYFQGKTYFKLIFVNTIHPVPDTDLPPQVEALVDTYDDLVGTRDPFLWRWLYTAIQPVRLSCVPSKYHDTVRTVKTLGTMYATTVDDIADRLGDQRLLDIAARIHSRQTDTATLDISVNDHDAAAHLEFARRSWERLEVEFRDAPRAEEFWPFLEFDMEQMIDAMWYAILVNDNPEMGNLAEGLGHESYSAVYYLLANIDLMYSPEFDRADLGSLRRVVWEGQQLHRLMNWVTTWERELEEGDITSGVIALALIEGQVAYDDVRRVRDGTGDVEQFCEQIRETDLESKLLDRWKSQFETLRETARTTDTRSVDLVAYVDGVKTVCQYIVARDQHTLLENRG